METYFDNHRTKNILLEHYEYFHHITADTYIESIKAGGLSPSFEHEQSHYFRRQYEPQNALRYCTTSNIQVGISAARRHTESFDHNEFIYKPNGAKLICITIPANSILNRSYGLDFSHGSQANDAEEEIKKNGLIDPECFLQYIQKYGCISCYEDIPSSEFLKITHIHG